MIHSRMRHHAAFAVTSALALVLAGPASAGGLDGHGAALPVGGEDLVQPVGSWLPAQELPEDGLRFDVMGEYGRRPLVEYTQTTRDGVTTRQIQSLLIDDFSLLHLGAKLRRGRFSVGGELPLFVATSGSLAGSGPAAGDLNLAAEMALRTGAQGVTAALRPSLRLPTGATHRALGDARAGGAIELAGSAWVGPLRVGAGVGVIGRSVEPEPELGITGGLGPSFGLSLGSEVVHGLALGAELRGAGGLHARDASGQEQSVVALESLFSSRLQLGEDTRLTLGIGQGLSAAAGAASPRVFAGVQVRRSRTPRLEPELVERVVPEGQFAIAVSDPRGQALPQAEVRLGDRVLGVTGDSGRLVVEESALRGWARQGLVVDAEGFAPSERLYPEKDESDGLFEAAVAWLPAPVHVVVKSGAGEPVPATVTVVGEDFEQFVSGEGDLLLPPKQVELRFTALGYGAQERTLLPSSEAPQSIEVILQPTMGDATLELDLRDPEGAPISQAQILVDGNPYGLSASKGVLRIEGLAPGEHTVEVRHDGFQSMERVVVLAEEPLALAPRLARVPGSVLVRVRDAAGPVADARVLFQGPARLEPAPLGEDGERLFTLRPGSWSALVMSPSHGLQARDLVVEPDATGLTLVDVVLGEAGGPGELRLVVVDPSGEPAEGVEVWLDDVSLGATSTGGALEVAGLDVGARSLSARGRGRRSVEGSPVFLVEGKQEHVLVVDWLPGMVELRAIDGSGTPVDDGMVRFVGPAARDPLPLPPTGREQLQLEPGTWQLLLSSPSRGLTSRSLELSDQSTLLTQVDLVVGGEDVGAADLAVEVLDPRGSPVPEAEVRLDGVLMGRTIGGVLQREDLGTGRRVVQAQAAGFRPAERVALFEEGENEVALTLGWGAGSTLVQVVDAAGGPVTDAVVRLAGPAEVSPARVSESGERLLHLAPGAWQLLVTSSEHGLALRTLDIPESITDLLVVRVELAPVSDALGSLVVRVVDPSGHPIHGAVVELDGEERAHTSAGLALVEALEAGVHPLAVRAPFHQTLRVPGLEVRVGAQERLVVLDWLPVPVDVVVVDGEGRPVSGAVLSVSGIFEVDGAVTDAHGHAMLELPPGDWRVAAQSEGLGARSASLQVALGEESAALRFELKAAKVTVSRESVDIVEAIRFDIGSPVLLDEAAPIIDEVADTLLANPKLAVVEVQGHTDSTGTLSRNLELSQIRAEVVMAALIERGVAPERLRAQGYGATRPVAPNDTMVGRKTNRRVQFEILEVRQEE